MMAAQLSAVDSIAPAMEMTKRQLFRPFRWGRWARLALVTLLSGEMSGSGGCNFSWPHGQDRSSSDLLALAFPRWESWLTWAPVVLLTVAIGVILLLILFYVHSVFRFILFDSVLYDRCEIRAAWRRWRNPGRRYFLWNLSFLLAVLLGLGVLVGVPVLLAWTQGIFREPKQHLFLLIGIGLLLLLLVIAYLVAAAVVGLFAKDFLVPMLAIEDLRVVEAWRRLYPMLKVDKSGYAVYVIMKIVLAIGAALVFGIIGLLALLALLIPFGVLMLGLYLIWVGLGLHWNPSVTTIAVLIVTVVLPTIIYVLGFVFTPVAVFFQAYVLHFFAGRYPALGEVMSPPPPPTPPALSEPAPAAAG